MGAEQTDKDALQKLLLDIDCMDELLPWIGGFNIFDVLKISRTEIRHSNVLAWLLSANETHGMGDTCFKGFLQCLVESNTDMHYDVLKVLLLDGYNFTVYREWKSIDLLLVSEKEKTVLAIENKVDSHEHSNQLNRYRELLEKTYEKYQRIYIYLTPEGEAPSDPEHWGILTYANIADVLDDALQQIELAPDVKLLVQNYKNIIRRDIVKDQELDEICNKIYAKHKKALDLIFDHRVDDRGQLSNIMRSTLQELDSEGKIIFEEPKRGNVFSFSFRTKELDDLLPLLDKPIGSWNSKNVYSYWFSLDSTGFDAYFELARLNVPEDEQKEMQKIMDALNPKESWRMGKQVKRLYTQRYTIKESDNTSEAIRQQVTLAVTNMLDWESDVLRELKSSATPTTSSEENASSD